MSRSYGIDLTRYHKLIVGEGESDRNFFAAFCANAGLSDFDYAFAASGFSSFVHYLSGLPQLAGFPDLADLVLVCDSTDNSRKRLTELHEQIRNANKRLGSKVYEEKPAENTVSKGGALRLHVLMVPTGGVGGIESVCFNVARDALDAAGHDGKTKEGWVNTFANSACVGWTTEKRDKLKLQALISAASPRMPEMHFSQIFDMTGNHFIPLDGPAFGQIKKFLEDVAAL